MKNFKYNSKLIILCALFGYCNNYYSQKDTLHIYYLGSQTNVLDSNDAKITKWAKSLKGKKTDVEIYAYYDKSDFKKFMAERADNIKTVVIRKARDFTTIQFSGPMKGEKWQRNRADIIYDRPRKEEPEEKVEEKIEEKKSDSTSVEPPK